MSTPAAGAPRTVRLTERGEALLDVGKPFARLVRIDSAIFEYEQGRFRYRRVKHRRRA